MDLATDQQKLAQRSLEVERLEAKYKMHEQVAGSSGSTDAGSVMKAISDYNNALSEASTAFKACNCSVCYGNNGEPDYGCPSALAFFANQPGEVKTQLCPNGSDSDSDFSRPTESIRN